MKAVCLRWSILSEEGRALRTALDICDVKLVCCPSSAQLKSEDKMTRLESLASMV